MGVASHSAHPSSGGLRHRSSRAAGPSEAAPAAAPRAAPGGAGPSGGAGASAAGRGASFAVASGTDARGPRAAGRPRAGGDPIAQRPCPIWHVPEGDDATAAVGPDPETLPPPQTDRIGRPPWFLPGGVQLPMGGGGGGGGVTFQLPPQLADALGGLRGAWCVRCCHGASPAARSGPFPCTVTPALPNR